MKIYLDFQGTVTEIDENEAHKAAIEYLLKEHFNIKI